MKRLQPPSDLVRIIAGSLVMVVAGCEPWNDSELSGLDHTTPQDTSGIAYFTPLAGEVWKYRIQKEIPIELRLSEADASLRPRPSFSFVGRVFGAGLCRSLPRRR